MLIYSRIIDNYNLIVDDAVIYKTKTGEEVKYDPLEFLALLTAHILKKYESITRYYGNYSSRVRGERKKRELAAQIAQAPATDGQAASNLPKVRGY